MRGLGGNLTIRRAGTATIDPEGRPTIAYQTQTGVHGQAFSVNVAAQNIGATPGQSDAIICYFPHGTDIVLADEIVVPATAERGPTAERQRTPTAPAGTYRVSTLGVSRAGIRVGAVKVDA